MLKLIPAALLALSALGLAAFQSAPQAPTAPKSPIAFEGSVMNAIQVRDIDAAKAWYERVLGSEVVYELPDKSWCEVTSPVKGSLIGLKRVEEGGTFQDNGGSRMSFGVLDMAQAKAWLVKNQVSIEGDVVEIPQTVKLLHFADRDGNKLLFYEPWKGN